MQKKSFNTQVLIKVALLSAIAFILMRVFKFPLPAFPTFLEIDFSELPAIVGSIVVGPFVGLGVVVIKNALAFFNSYTGGVGELANLLVSLGYLLPLAFMLKKDKSFKTIIIGLGLGTVAMAIVGAFANYFILIPLYGLEVEKLPFVLTVIIPFNLIKGVIVSIVSAVIIKAMQPALRYLSLKKSN
ncbi:ECF transporter S component [Niameybacter massiliensis]|uniref:Riboflavin transporter n=1 Tax=Holtiella tumoricola TaxID=3018743 RepID=A0AA42IYK6_9FIRM|nr:ECF transporter S component [Holtiella tumoricola]MDA3729995.1 ECF transporter S component [Holtiella tumoricola]